MAGLPFLLMRDTLSDGRLPHVGLGDLGTSGQWLVSV